MSDDVDREAPQGEQGRGGDAQLDGPLAQTQAAKGLQAKNTLPFRVPPSARPPSVPTSQAPVDAEAVVPSAPVEVADGEAPSARSRGGATMSMSMSRPARDQAPAWLASGAEAAAQDDGIDRGTFGASAEALAGGMIRLPITLNRAEQDQLGRLCRATGLSASDVLRQALQLAFEQRFPDG